MIFFCHFFGKSVVFKLKTIGRWFGKNLWYHRREVIKHAIDAIEAIDAIDAIIK